MLGSWKGWQRGMLCGLAACAFAGAALSVLLIGCPGSVTWTVGTAHALRLKMFMPEHEAVFCARLRVTVPASWECDEEGCRYYGFSVKPISHIFFSSTASTEGGAGQSAMGPQVSTDSVLIGGVSGVAHFTATGLAPGFLIATVTVEDRSLRIGFLGRQQDWALWKDALNRGEWLKQDQ